MVIASWILNVEPDRRGAARERIAGIAGARVSDLEDPLVVTTWCADGDLGRMHQALAGVPGVLTVAMVTAYKDRAKEDGS